MMHRVITNLIDAQSYMPDGIPRKIRNDMLLTVLFLQLLSEAWHDDLARTDDARQAQCPQCPVMFDALCDFKTCLVAYRQPGSALLQTSAGRGLHVESYDDNTILHTMKCFRKGTIDPHLFETDTALITANDFSFDYRAYF